jgi:hypothetical protein
MPVRYSKPPAPDPRAVSFPWRAIGWGLALALWITPFVAMQFTEEVQWGPGDFLVFGAMLAVAGGLLELAARTSRNLAYRAGVLVAVLAGFLLTWASLAVGTIGAANHPDNLMLGGVWITAVLGAGRKSAG